MKDPKSNDRSDYVVAGLVGAVAGAISAVVATAMLNKEHRKNLGENLINISDKILQRLNSLNKSSTHEKIPSKTSK